ncbi:homocysteine S-methyltransferase family protein [Mailhella massiliensis]
MVLLRKECGLRIFGGCCGTTDRHMEAMASKLCAHERQNKEPLPR